MGVFETVKENISTRQAAEYYGVLVNRRGMAVCPFHNDKNPSMKVDKRYHCFGCQEDGDVIDFTAKMYGLSLKEAAQKLAEDFNINCDHNSRASPKPTKRKVSLEEQFRQAEEHCYRVLSDYYHLLRRWKEEFAPVTAEEEWNPLFLEALSNMTILEYRLDILLTGELKDRADLIKELGEEVKEIEQRIREYNTRDEKINDGSS